MMSDEPARSGTGSAEEAANVLAKIATRLTSVQGIVTTFVAICVALGGLVTGSCKLRMFAPAAVCQVLAPVEGETKKQTSRVSRTVRCLTQPLKTKISQN